MATLNAERTYIPPLRGRCIAYLRQSTRLYGRLNADAQLNAIRDSLVPQKTMLLEKYTELEPLVGNDRPELRRAIEHCKAAEATLIVGQIDRMRGRVRWLKIVIDAGIKFRGADAPHINQLSFNRLMVSDLHWREELGRSVAASLARKKEKGAVLGGNRGHGEGLKLGPAASARARRYKADARDAKTWNVIQDIRYRGIGSLVGIAERLTQMGHPAPRGGDWSPAQVRRIVKKFNGE